MPVLLPLKALAEAKGRLAPGLAPVERRQLARAMAIDLLDLLTTQPGVGPVVVCGSDASAESIARRAGVRFLPETQLRVAGLNAVVNAAAAMLAGEGLDDLLVVHGDLPLLTSAELARFLRVHAGAGDSAVTLAPDRWREGTNLLAWRGLAKFRAQYGPGSFQRHCANARVAGAHLSVCELAGAGVDVDVPADLQVARAAGDALALHTRALLRDLSPVRVAPRLSWAG